MVKRKRLVKEDWINSGNNDSQVNVECDSSAQDLDNCNKIANLRNEHITILGGKPRTCVQWPVQGKLLSPKVTDDFNELLRTLSSELSSSGRDEMSKFVGSRIVQSGRLCSIDAIQIPVDAIITGIGFHKVHRKHKKSQDCLIDNDNITIQMSEFHDKHYSIIKTDCSQIITAKSSIDRICSDISVIEDSMNDIVDGIDPATSFQLTVKEVSQTSTPCYKTIYKLQQKQEEVIHRHNSKTTKFYQRKWPLSNADESTLPGTNPRTIGIPNGQEHLPDHARLRKNSSNTNLNK